MTSERESRSRRAIATVGAERFLRFLRAVADENVLAIRLANEDLNADATLESIFFTGEDFGYTASARRLGKGRFAIGFGFLADPLAGDGGEWTVTFDAKGRVTACEVRDLWIA